MSRVSEEPAQLPNIVIHQLYLNMKCSLLNVGAQASVLGNHQIAVWTPLWRRQMGWGAQWQIIVIMVTQWGRVMEKVPCEAILHGSFTRENQKEKTTR